ncbi:MAG: AbrB/MazE/SpoVT family DNA-binding domain-containing protein [Syntrophobacteraceae bacterium]
MESYVSVKGQIVIPAPLRRKYGIKSGTKIQIHDDGERIILKPITDHFYGKLRGSLKGKKALKVLIADRADEKEK